jgi:hypothetical protein
MLARDLIGLLLHHRVEQENTEHADGEHKSETGGERRLATAWCRRTRGHQADDDRTLRAWECATPTVAIARRVNMEW